MNFTSFATQTKRILEMISKNNSVCTFDANVSDKSDTRLPAVSKSCLMGGGVHRHKGHRGRTGAHVKELDLKSHPARDDFILILQHKWHPEDNGTLLHFMCIAQPCRIHAKVLPGSVLSIVSKTKSQYGNGNGPGFPL